MGIFFVPVAILVCASLLVFFGVFFTVEQQTVAIVERFGKFQRAATAGLNLKIPFVETVKGILSLRIQQLDVIIETKTKDNVFVKVVVSVQYNVVAAKIYDAFYKLTNPQSQIESFVFDVIRAEVPKMTLDDVFEKKDNIAIAVKNELAEVMSEFGYDIIKSLVTNIDPDVRVKAAMNEINEQQRLRMAAQEKGEAEKILRVKKAEGEAESMHLQGIGVSNQRKAIIEGLKESIMEFQQGVSGISAEDVMALVTTIQYYDTLKEIGDNNKSSTVFLPHSAASMNEFASQLRDNVMIGSMAGKDISQQSSAQ